jgi:hypothetical protein
MQGDRKAGFYSHGVHGSGSREYSPRAYALVVAALKRLGDDEPITVTALSEQTGVPGRAVREIVSAADGVDILIGGSGVSGYTVARTRRQAAIVTAKLTSQARRMAERSERRVAFAALLPDA